MLTQSTTQRKIFISYRRADHLDFVERVRDWLAWMYGRDSVFMDFDTIPPFTRFADFIRDKVRACDVLVAIIGPQWLELLRGRLDDPDGDYVRLEIRLALAEGKPIAPICIKNAPVPRHHDLPPDLRPMLDYNVGHLNSGQDFPARMERLLSSLEAELVRLDGLKVMAAVQTTQFDVHAAIQRFQEALDRREFSAALDWLTHIRNSGYMPRFYPIDDYEREVREALHLEAARRDYDIIRSMAERALKGREDARRIWGVLREFWQTYPDYDPDDLASRFRPVDMAASVRGEVSRDETLVGKTARGEPKFDPALFDDLANADLAAAERMFALDSLARTWADELAPLLSLAEAEKQGIMINTEQEERADAQNSP